MSDFKLVSSLPGVQRDAKNSLQYYSLFDYSLFTIHFVIFTMCVHNICIVFY